MSLRSISKLVLQEALIMIALLPMKAHSERVPDKNKRLINGRPLFFYIADTLKGLGIFDLLVINTDSPEIARLAKDRYGHWVFIIDRPDELIGDLVPMNLIIAHDIATLGVSNTYFQTHSTNPLLSANTIWDAVERYHTGTRNGELDSLFSVNSLKTRLYDKELNPINHNPSILARTQDLDITYEENSNFYIFSGESFASSKSRIGSNPSIYIMKRNSLEGVDIDEIDDFIYAETIIKSKHTHG